MSNASKNRDTAADADLEPNIGHASVGAKKTPRFDAPCNITFVHVRTRLADSDGISGKAAIDGIVHAGILADDSPKQVTETRHRQVKAGRGEPEKTIVILDTLNAG
jgi:hypothetical protein